MRVGNGQSRQDAQEEEMKKGSAKPRCVDSEVDCEVVGKNVLIYVYYGGGTSTGVHVLRGVVREMTRYWVYFEEHNGAMHIINKAYIVEYVLPKTFLHNQGGDNANT